VNQTLGTALAFAFLVGVGIFSLVLGVSDLRKGSRGTSWGWLRILLALLLFGIAVWFFRQLTQGSYP
jgi:hypothetical protein